MRTIANAVHAFAPTRPEVERKCGLLDQREGLETAIIDELLAAER
jgi:hypothetical protein